MQLIIFKDTIVDNTEDIEEFVYDYLINHMYNIIDYHLKYLPLNELRQIEEIDKNFNISSKEIILAAFKKLEVIEDQSSYIIKFNNSIVYNGLTYNKWINLITYGSLSVKGYSYIINFFNDIAENINEIYTVWRET